jgi:2-octaprenyl-6-methoxyphenol hydroxylase
MNDATSITDAVIAGGGPVGLAAALALAGNGFRVTLLEARSGPAAGADPRPIALSHGSRLILERLNAWRALDPTPITTVHVSHREQFGRTVMTAAQAGLPALGYVVGYRTLHAALHVCAERAGIDVRQGWKAERAADAGEWLDVDIVYDGGAARLGTRLLVVADGGGGLARATIRDYHQAAVTARVATELPHCNRAFERFTHDGPLALLPFGSDMGLVWTAPPAAARELGALDEAEFLARLHRHFGDRMGIFTAVGPRAVFALALRRAAAPVGARTVLIGNAAQALHPVAGQGFNLGLRDVRGLAQCLRRGTPDVGASRVLRAFAAARRADRRHGVNLTDFLARAFVSERTLLPRAAGIAFTVLDCLPPVKDVFVRRAVFGV